MARDPAATALVNQERGTGIGRCAVRRRACPARLRLRLAVAPAMAAVLIAPLVLAASPAAAASNKVRITQLGDIAFGTIANLAADSVRSENVCLFADTNTNGYNVTATGTGPGGAFQLASGGGAMAYEVQWSSASGQSSGAQLSPNVPLTGQVSGATHQSCSSGPAATASLVVVLRAAALSSATAGTYSGTLTLVVGPE